MLQKAAKSLAVRNASTLQRTHLISLFLNTVFILLRYFLGRPKALLPYLLLSTPAFAIEFYLERVGRPTYNADGSLRKSGDDLEAKGITEYMWDVLYWTWACIGAACLFGDRGWWLYLAVPIYSAYLAVTTFGGMRQSLAGMQGEGSVQAAESKRQKKMERRGVQKVQYRA